MIRLSTLFLLAGFSPFPGDDPGPTSPNGRLHSYDVVSGIFQEVVGRAIPATEGNIWPYEDGPIADLWADASRQCEGRLGAPLIVELSVGVGTDTTVISYGPTGQLAAETIAGRIKTIGWPIVTVLDPALPDLCPSVKVTMGAVNGPLGRSYLGLAGWRTSFGAQLADGILAAIVVPVEE